MRHPLLALLLLLFLAPSVHAQELLHYWNFNDPEAGTPWSSPVDPSQTIGGGALTHDFAEGTLQSFTGTSLNAQDGDAAGSSFAVQLGPESANNGRAFDLHVPTSGYQNITLRYDSRGTSSGFTTHTVSYSTDGSSFSDLRTVDGRASTSFSTIELDLTDVEAANDNADLVVRVQLDGATTDSGNNRFDNITVWGFASGSNLPPDFTSVLPDQTIDAGVELTHQFEAVDSDGDELTFALVEAPAGASLNPATGVFSWTPAIAQGDRSHTITVEVTDGDLTTSTSAVVYVVAYPDNSAPAIVAALPDTVLRVGDELTYTFEAEDADDDELSWTLVAAPQGAVFDEAGRTLTWTVTTPGAYPVVVHVTDDKATVESETIVGVRGLLFGDLEGEALRDRLRELYSPDQVLSYDQARDSMYAVLDLDDDGFVRGVYTGFGVPLDGTGTPRSIMTAGGIDAEHTWPQSKGADTGNARSDLHHLFPSRSTVNSARGNMPFGEVQIGDVIRWYRGTQAQTDTPTDDLGTYSRLGAQRFQPRDAHAGAAARAILYFFTTYESSADPLFLPLQAADILDWSERFVPTADEFRRTYQISRWQGNANPFIFDSTLAERVLVDIEAPEAMPIGAALELEDGEPAIVAGIVTRARGRFIRLQDDTGAVTVYQNFGGLANAVAAGDVAAGDSLLIAGSLDTFNALRQISGIASFEVLSRENELPAPESLSHCELTCTFEQIRPEHVSMLVRVDGFHIDAGNERQFEENTSYRLTDADGTPLDFDLRIQRSGDSELVGTDIPGGMLTFTGVLGRYNDDMQLDGVLETDLEAYVGSSTPEIPAHAFDVSAVYPNPTSGAAEVGVTLGTPQHVLVELVDVLGRRVALLHEGTIPAGEKRGLTVPSDRLPSGLYFLRVTAGYDVRQQSVVVVR